MPPKARFDREDIVRVGLEIARESGIEAVTAQAVSKKLGTSVSPIFTHFETIEEIREEVKEMAWGMFSSCLKTADDYNPTFKMRGIQMVKFAQKEPKLFYLLFMNEPHTVDFNDLMSERIEGFADDIKAIEEIYGLDEETAKHIFSSVWVYAYGICSLCVMNVCSFSESEISALLGEMFSGAMHTAKCGNKELYSIMPAKKGTQQGDMLGGKLPL